MSDSLTYIFSPFIGPNAFATIMWWVGILIGGIIALLVLQKYLKR